MSTNTIETQEAPETTAKLKRTAAEKTKSDKKIRRPKKPARKLKASRGNKRAVVIGLLKRAKGATLAEIITATGWQAHTVRGFVSILGGKVGEVSRKKVPKRYTVGTEVRRNCRMFGH